MSDGVVVVDKPAGMTSHDVVDEVRRRLGERRVGHAGTLDPDATGVLVLGVGKATRVLQYAQAQPKRYRAGARFGTTTTTQDSSGEIVAQRDASSITRPHIERELRGFVGAIEQVPPMVSAVKVGGERLYRKARRGEDVERAPRTVHVYSFELTAFDPGDEPGAAFDVRCSAGTYVRTLIHDLGERLGVGAHLVSLRRTEAAGLTERDAVALDDVSAAVLLPVVEAVRFMPRIQVDDDGARLVATGRALDGGGAGVDGETVAVVRDGRLLAVYRRRENRLIPDRVIPW